MAQKDIKSIDAVLYIFMRHILLLILSGVIFAGCNAQTNKELSVAQSPVSTERPFFMGTSRWPSDLTDAGVQMAETFVRDHADIVVLHFDNGVPWPEAYEGKPYSDNLNHELSYQPPPGHKLYVAVSPLTMGRDGMALYWGATGNQPLPDAWKNISLDSESVEKAYLTFVTDVVEKLHPDFLAIGIEVNMLQKKNPAMWPAYVHLHQYVYMALKKRYPELPIFASFEALHLNGLVGGSDKDEQYQQAQLLMPYNDILGLSVHPFMTYEISRPIPEDFFDFAKQFKKPIAIAESSYTSKTVWAGILPLMGSEEDQSSFMNTMLRTATRDKYIFVINFSSTDYEHLVEKLPNDMASFAKIWEYTGLQHSDGTPKPVLALWNQYLAVPKTSSAP